MILAFGVITAAAVGLVGDSLFTRESEKNGAYVENRVNRIWDFPDARELYDFIRSVSECGGCRTLYLYENSVIQLDSYSESNGIVFAPPESGIYKSEEIAPLASEGSSVTDLHVYSMGGGKLLVCAFDMDGAIDAVAVIGRNILLVSAALFVVTVLVSLLVTRSFTAPVADLNTAISALSMGDFSVRVPESGNNEFTDLIRAFNDMTGRMETLDRSRNQFVSNASHELKTPLATMKILIESLIYQEVFDEGMAREFLGDINNEIDRLNNVVKDLLTLVGMDSGETRLNEEPFSLTAMVKDNVKRLSPLARERGIALGLSAGIEIGLTGDRTKLDQVFYNLIDNAIKYTPRGGKVDVELLRQGKNALVKVKDNGIGIPEEDIKHIFDRFYRVDKARSRETGGTGLGLSIVKQTILLHGGNISVHSKVDEGTAFTVQLPIGK